jgi:hypothetical protein
VAAGSTCFVLSDGPLFGQLQAPHDPLAQHAVEPQPLDQPSRSEPHFVQPVAWQLPRSPGGRHSPSQMRFCPLEP